MGGGLFWQGASLSKSLEEVDEDSSTARVNTLSLKKKSITGTFNTLMGHIRRKSGPTTPVLERSSSRTGKTEEKAEVGEVVIIKWAFMRVLLFSA